MDPGVFCVINYLDDTTYEGSVVNGCKDGFGVMTLRDTSTYMGEFSEVRDPPPPYSGGVH